MRGPWRLSGRENKLTCIADRCTSINESPFVALLPPFPALTTVNVELFAGRPSARLAYILSRIHSAPTLASIVFTLEEWPSGGCLPPGLWNEVDEWLARMVVQTEVEGSLTVILEQRPEDEPVLEECLPEFRKAGGEVRIKVTADGS